MKVRYMYKNGMNDLICELTEFIDTYLIDRLKRLSWMKTYLWESIDDGNRIAFRLPGATRGCVDLERVDENRFKIIDIHFYEDTCFSDKLNESKCYKKEIVEDVKKYIGQELDFSEVRLKIYASEVE